METIIKKVNIWVNSHGVENGVAMASTQTFSIILSSNKL